MKQPKHDTSSISTALYNTAKNNYCFDWIEPQDRAAHIIDRMKINPQRSGVYQEDNMFQHSFTWIVLFSPYFNLTQEQKDFAIHCAFNKFPTNGKRYPTYTPVSDPIYTGHQRGINTDLDLTNVVFDGLERWGIIDALELYAKSESDGRKWFKEQKIPRQHVYQIINNDQFGKKYKKLQKACQKIPQKCCHGMDIDDQCVNNTGRVYMYGCRHLYCEAIELIQNGEYDISKYNLIKLLGPEQNHYQLPGCKNPTTYVQNQFNKITSKEDLEKYLKLLHILGWHSNYFGVYHCFYGDDRAKMRKILGVCEKETDINNFDLNNQKDVERCEDLFPLVLKYPYLFNKWYPQDKYGRYLDNKRPLFVPDHEHYLARCQNLGR